ncbi:winged helix-turn-helix transcriptional regulator [Streptomyces zagrosensis]|uniref:DNA-binding HxlR family transcriptional regulator n=1 Tax=Streptomyces zagrosensis TaxID=1042984 RepID=A0A7W9V275_9ACTN|nr:winged helix-turn-helix transcriptional regulator [Streptomyces zagrosensis]MBB5939975.1 DNA-binding HxlR family transcriptional regulator [Streptomyces zagrosensis]
MPSPAQPFASSIGSVDAQRVEDALSLIAPKWTTWSAQTLAQQDRPMRVRDVAARLPFVSEQLISKRLGQMHEHGLVSRADDRRGAPYQLSALGTSLSRVHHALSDWSQVNLSLGGQVAGAERVEDAVRRLHLRHSTAVIQILDAGGPTRLVHIAEEVGLDNALTRQRLNRLQADGLVTRTGPRHGDPYVLTDAGRALGPVYAVVERWSNPVAVRKHSAPPVSTMAAALAQTDVPLGTDGIRTAAALRRSTAVPNAMFSHAPHPQPQVPAAVARHTAPTRGR